MILSRRAALLLLIPVDADELQALMVRLAAVAERRGTFREERVLGALTEPLVSTGRLFDRRPDYLEKDTLWPLREQMVIDGSRLVISDPASNEPPHVVPLDADPGLRSLAEGLRAPLAGDLAALRRAFTVSMGGTLEAWTLRLVPRAGGPVAAIRVLGAGDWIASIEVAQANGDRSTMRIAPG